MKMPDVSDQMHMLCESVQHNCNVSDANHASDYTLCIYLMKMREYFRWEYGYRFSDALPQEEIGKWIVAREEMWDDLEEQPYRALSINGTDVAPFDADTINRVLLPAGYIYSAGIGPKAAAHFFMGALSAQETRQGYPVFIAGKEYARDIAALPAMCINETIFVRRESLQRMLWESLNEWRWHQSPGLLEKAFSYYDFDDDLESALEKMCTLEIDTLIMHEIGELKASAEIDSHCNGTERWHQMLTTLPRSRAEISVRTVKDHLADVLYTLPELIRQQRIPSLCFHIARLPPLHKHIFPSLVAAAQRWQESNNFSELKQLITRAQKHWLSTALDILKLSAKIGGYSKIATLVESRRL